MPAWEAVARLKANAAPNAIAGFIDGFLVPDPEIQREAT
jgi:hypothetical protein